MKKKKKYDDEETQKLRKLRIVNVRKKVRRRA